VGAIMNDAVHIELGGLVSQKAPKGGPAQLT
jgi:hypothetical protein